MTVGLLIPLLVLILAVGVLGVALIAAARGEWGIVGGIAFLIFFVVLAGAGGLKK